MKRFSLATILFFVLITFGCNNQKNDTEKQGVHNFVNEYLIYISNRGEGFDLYRNDLSGNEQTLTGFPGWEWGAQFVKPNRIIFNWQDTLNNFTMAEIDIDGNIITNSVVGFVGYNIASNGKKVVFSRKEGNNTVLKIASSNDLRDSLVFASEGYNGRPKWSNNNDKIAFISDRSGSNEIYIYDIQSSMTTKLTENNKREKYITWSPDDETIAATMNTDSTNIDIYIINVRNKQITQLTQSEINEEEIAWSSVGNSIAYHAKIDDSDDIYIIDTESKKIRKVTSGEGYHGEPVWAQVVH